MGTRAATAGLTMALLIVTATGCESDSEDAVRGSGDIVTEVREVSGFSEVHLEGSGDVVVEIGENESLTVEADDNLGTPLEVAEPPPKGSELYAMGNPLDLGLTLAAWGGYTVRLILRNPEDLARVENHPSWTHMYLMMMAAQIGFAVAYLV